MKSAVISKVDFTESKPSLELISSALDKLPKQAIDTINWPAYPYRPELAFAIGYTNDELLLKFYVREKEILAERTESNQSVCTDCCVEIFFSPKRRSLLQSRMQLHWHHACWSRQLPSR